MATYTSSSDNPTTVYADIGSTIKWYAEQDGYEGNYSSTSPLSVSVSSTTGTSTIVLSAKTATSFKLYLVAVTPTTQTATITLESLDTSLSCVYYDADGNDTPLTLGSKSAVSVDNTNNCYIEFSNYSGSYSISYSIVFAASGYFPDEQTGLIATSSFGTEQTLNSSLSSKTVTTTTVGLTNNVEITYNASYPPLYIAILSIVIDGSSYFIGETSIWDESDDGTGSQTVYLASNGITNYYTNGTSGTDVTVTVSGTAKTYDGMAHSFSSTGSSDEQLTLTLKFTKASVSASLV